MINEKMKVFIKIKLAKNKDKISNLFISLSFTKILR